jgi:hypothetical protein
MHRLLTILGLLCLNLPCLAADISVSTIAISHSDQNISLTFQPMTFDSTGSGAFAPKLLSSSSLIYVELRYLANRGIKPEFLMGRLQPLGPDGSVVMKLPINQIDLQRIKSGLIEIRIKVVSSEILVKELPKEMAKADAVATIAMEHFLSEPQLVVVPSRLSDAP